MAKINREESEYLDKFLEQAALLMAASRNYDEGLGVAALGIAVHLRTLFYDKGSSISVLEHIKKKNIEMLDSSIYTDDSLNLGLVQKQFSKPYKTKYTVPDSDNHKLTYIPYCYSIVPFDKWVVAKKRWVSMDEWLNQVICYNKTIPEAKMSRLDVVKMTADKDGGAHVDTTVDPAYNHFRFQNSGLNERDLKDWENKKIINVPIYPILRQMAFEVLYSFMHGGLMKPVPILWRKDFSWFKGHVSLLDEFHPLKQMRERVRLNTPNSLNPKGNNDSDEEDEFHTGTIKM